MQSLKIKSDIFREKKNFFKKVSHENENHFSELSKIRGISSFFMHPCF